MIPVAEEILVEAVDKISKSVVNIASVRMIHDQLFRVFPVQGVGSGVIIDKDGILSQVNGPTDLNVSTTSIFISYRSFCLAYNTYSHHPHKFQFPLF